MYIFVTELLHIIMRRDVFQAIADPTRREILGLLTAQSLNLNSVAGNFNISRPAVSKHIKIMYNAGFISIQDIGRERHCVLKQEGFNEVQNWINYFDKFWETKLKKLESLLDQKTKK